MPKGGFYNNLVIVDIMVTVIIIITMTINAVIENSELARASVPGAPTPAPARSERRPPQIGNKEAHL